MTAQAHLWAVAYDELTRAEAARQKVLALGGRCRSLVLLDTAILACQADGSFTLDRKPLSDSGSIRRSKLSLLVGLAFVGPLTGYAVDAMLGDISNSAGISDGFVSEIKTLLKPGVSALLVLDEEGSLEEILTGVQGLGGIVVKTNVDLDRAKLIQATLSYGPSDTNGAK